MLLAEYGKQGPDTNASAIAFHQAFRSREEAVTSAKISVKPTSVRLGYDV